MFSVKTMLKQGRRLTEIPLQKISPSPDQPRRNFDPYELKLLADSILKNGLLQPVTVRRAGEGFELIAGERRVRAAILAGLESIPAIVHDISREEAAVYTIIENLQREDLSPFDEAEGIRRLITVYGVSQCDAAERLGIAQSTLSNKLRLLRLPDTQRERITKAGLSERHARVLLRAPEDRRDELLDKIIAEGLTVRESEQAADELLKKEKKTAPIRRCSLSDTRLFQNSLGKLVNTMVDAGYNAKTHKKETESYVEYVVRIDKRPIQMRLL